MAGNAFQACDLCGKVPVRGGLRQWTEQYALARPERVLPGFRGVVEATVLRSCEDCELDARVAVVNYWMKDRVTTVATWLRLNAPVTINPSAQDDMTLASVCAQHPSAGVYVEPQAPCLGQHLENRDPSCAICGKRVVEPRDLTERVGSIRFEEGAALPVRTLAGETATICGELIVTRLAMLCSDCGECWPLNFLARARVRPVAQPDDAA
jgi:hypothetical protein